MAKIAIAVGAPCSSCEKKWIYLVVLLYVTTYILTVLWQGYTIRCLLAMKDRLTYCHSMQYCFVSTMLIAGLNICERAVYQAHLFEQSSVFLCHCKTPASYNHKGSVDTCWFERVSCCCLRWFMLFALVHPHLLSNWASISWWCGGPCWLDVPSQQGTKVLLSCTLLFFLHSCLGNHYKCSHEEDGKNVKRVCHRRIALHIISLHLNFSKQRYVYFKVRVLLKCGGVNILWNGNRNWSGSIVYCNLCFLPEYLKHTNTFTICYLECSSSLKGPVNVPRLFFHTFLAREKPVMIPFC